MRIRKAKVWNKFKIVSVILKETPTLDPLVLVWNSDFHYIEYKNEIVSFLTIKRYGPYYELGTVYTFPKFRNKGFMKKLVKFVLSRKRKIFYLICYEDKKRFYQVFGFRQVQNSPWIFRYRAKLRNYFLKPFSRKKLIVMKNYFKFL